MYVLAEVSTVTSGNQESEPPMVPMSATQPPAAQEQTPESAAANAQVSEAQLHTTVASGPASTATEQGVPQTAALPVADMQALAKRIGMATPALPQPSKRGPEFLTVPDLGMVAQPQAVCPSRPAVNAPGVVPSEIQAIIQKLVYFIKVGPSGHVRPPQRLLHRAWQCQQPSLKQTKLFCTRV